MGLTKEEITRASKIAVKNSQDTIKTFDGQKLAMWRGLWDSKMFTPSIKKDEAQEFIKRHRGRPRKV